MKCHEIQPTSCWSSRELCCNDGSVSNAGRLLCYYCCLGIEELYETRSLLANKLIVLDQISLDQIEPIVTSLHCQFEMSTPGQTYPRHILAAWGGSGKPVASGISACAIGAKGAAVVRAQGAYII